MNDARDVLTRPYRRVLIFDAETKTYTGLVQEMPGCVAQGATPGEAMADLDDAMVAWVEAATEQSQAVPAPLEEVEHSGRVLVRMSTSMHRKLAERAQEEGVSVNHLVVTALAGYLGMVDTQTGIVRETLQRVLSVLARGKELVMARETAETQAGNVMTRGFQVETRVN